MTPDGVCIGRALGAWTVVLVLASCRCGATEATTDETRRDAGAQQSGAPGAAGAERVRRGSGESGAAGAEDEPSGPLRGERLDEAPGRPAMADEGIFSDLDERVRLAFPDRLERDRIVAVREEGAETAFAFVAGRAVGLAPEGWEPTVEVASWGEADADDDGIPDTLDVLLGARKAALNGADYTEGYVGLDYPGGDVPRDEGVCTDVVVRTFRNAGYDLQKLLHEDIEAHPEAYPMVDTPDPNIDHRRVRTLLPWLKRHWRALSTDPDDPASLWLPGDVVVMDTMGDERPEHIGIVGARRGESGHPLILNNWTQGYETSAMDLLGSVPVTHRFRLARGDPPLPTAQQGLRGLLARRGMELPEETAQVVAVTTVGWDRPTGTLRRYERGDDGTWTRVGEPFPVQLGAAGLGWGRGLHELPEEAGRSLPVKEEGDERAPAGLFRLGTAFGPSGARPEGARWPWREVADGDVFVDDPEAERYNRWARHDGRGAPPWSSAEDMTRYRLGVVVEHNLDPVVPGAGSAIFLHTDGGRDVPTLGCTAMDAERLRTLVAWLDPEAPPVLVQLPGWIRER